MTFILWKVWLRYSFASELTERYFQRKFYAINNSFCFRKFPSVVKFKKKLILKYTGYKQRTCVFIIVFLLIVGLFIEVWDIFL
jgi:hypothetical protein